MQYNDTSVERDRFFKSSGIKISKIEKIDNYNDLNGLTSLIDICDFVITVSNTNAHLSGALGKDTFLYCQKEKVNYGIGVHTKTNVIGIIQYKLLNKKL